MPTVLPFYIVLDTSTSMHGERIDSVNRALPELHGVIAGHPVIADRCLLSVMSFATVATTDLSLSNLSTVPRMPTLSAGGQTRFDVALRHLRSSITQDVTMLKQEHFTVLRPCAFFITDGRPTGGWRRLRDEVVDRHMNATAPNIVAYGVEGADVDVLRRLSTRYTLTTDAGTPAAAGLREVFTSIATSVVASATGTTTRLVIQPASKNMRVYDNEQVA